MRHLEMALFLIIPTLAGATSMRGNLNLSYQASRNGTNNSDQSSFHQIMNLYLYDRVFYSNDLTMGAYIFHSKLSNRDRGDFRIRYSAGMIGYRYNLYTSYMPYTTYPTYGASEKTRVFVASLNITPRFLPAVNSSYNSTRQYTSDTPRAKSGANYSWNVGTQIAKSFGSFRAVYQKQQGKVYAPISQNQTQQTINLGYDIAGEMPLKVISSVSYAFTGTKLDRSQDVADYTRTHNGAAQFSRGFGERFSVSAASSGRFSDYERDSRLNRLRDWLVTGAANLKIRSNLSVMLLRNYNSSENESDTTSSIVNDYVSLSGQYTFGEGAGNGGRLSISRGLYLESALGRAHVTNAAALFDLALYRDTDASINLTLSHNDKTLSSQGKYSMIRTIDIASRPTERTTLNITYNSSLASNNIDFADYSSDNLSINFNHALKWYFSYSATFTRSSSHSGKREIVTSSALAVNYRISNALSAVSTYTRRDLGQSNAALSENIDQSVSSQLTWTMARKANLRVNHAVLGLGSEEQSHSYGGNLAINF